MNISAPHSHLTQAYEFYYGSDQVTQDYALAMEHAEKAADQGSADAQSLISYMYYFGDGVEQDFHKAIKWASQAAAGSNYNAHQLLERIYLDELPNDYVPDPALDYMHRCYLGFKIWHRGSMDYEVWQPDLPPQYDKIPSLLSQAVEKEYSPAKYLLALYYEYGPSRFGLAASENGLNLMKEAASSDFPPAQLQMWTSFQNHKSEDTDPSPEQYLNWLENAAKEDLREAQLEMGILYLNGEFVSQNDEVAVEWLKKAAAQNHPTAQYHLALAYRDGKGITQDTYEYRKLIYEAAPYVDEAEAERVLIERSMKVADGTFR